MTLLTALLKISIIGIILSGCSPISRNIYMGDNLKKVDLNKINQSIKKDIVAVDVNFYSVAMGSTPDVEVANLWKPVIINSLNDSNIFTQVDEYKKGVEFKRVIKINVTNIPPTSDEMDEINKKFIILKNSKGSIGQIINEPYSFEMTFTETNKSAQTFHYNHEHLYHYGDTNKNSITREVFESNKYDVMIDDVITNFLYDLSKNGTFENTN